MTTGLVEVRLQRKKRQFSPILTTRSSHFTGVRGGGGGGWVQTCNCRVLFFAFRQLDRPESQEFNYCRILLKLPYNFKRSQSNSGWWRRRCLETDAALGKAKAGFSFIYFFSLIISFLFCSSHQSAFYPSPLLALQLLLCFFFFFFLLLSYSRR